MRGKEGGRGCRVHGAERDVVDGRGLKDFSGLEGCRRGLEYCRRGERDASGLHGDGSGLEVIAEGFGQGTGLGDAGSEAGGLAVVVCEEDSYGSNCEGTRVGRGGVAHRSDPEMLLHSDKRRGMVIVGGGCSSSACISTNLRQSHMCPQTSRYSQSGAHTSRSTFPPIQLSHWISIESSHPHLGKEIP